MATSWEPHWLDPLEDRERRALVEAVHDSLTASGFRRGSVYGPSIVGRFDTETERRDGIA